MSDTSVDTAPAALGIGNVLSRSISILFANIIPFSIVGALFLLPIVLYSAYFTMDLMENTKAAMENDEAAIANTVAAMEGIWVQGIIISLLTVALAFMVQSVITFGTIQNLRGQKLDIGAACGRAISILLPVIVMSLLITIGIGFGMMLLIVPGIILAMMWYVAVPAMVVEKAGIFGSMARSRALTKGNRWHVFGIALILLVINIAVGLLVGLFLEDISMVSVIVEFVYTVFLTVYGAVVAAVVYHDLRVAHEGVDTDQIASVFD